MTSEELYGVIKQSIPSDYLERMYGGIAKDDPQGAAVDKESAMRALSEARPVTYANLLETLNHISYLDSEEINLKRAAALLDSLKKRRMALESK